MQAKLDALKQQFIRDVGGDPSQAQLALIDLVVAGMWKSHKVEQYVATLDHLVDRKHRRVWAVVRDATYLAQHVAGLLAQLGLERKAAPIESLASYIARKDAAAVTAGDDSAAVCANGGRTATQGPE